jgi:hypothetical protein
MLTNYADWRHELGMTRAALGKALGLGRGQVNLVIADDAEPDRLMSLALAGLRAERRRDAGQGVLKSTPITVPACPPVDKLMGNFRDPRKEMTNNSKDNLFSSLQPGLLTDDDCTGRGSSLERRPERRAPGEDDYFRVAITADSAGVNLIDTRYFPRLDAATSFAADDVRSGYRWIAERGTYKTRKDTKKEGWIFFWWSPGTPWLEPYERGCGIPETRWRRNPVNYFPFDPTYQPPPWQAHSISELRK